MKCQAQTSPCAPLSSAVRQHSHMDTPSPQPIEAVQPTSRRPTVITVICVVGFVGALLVVPRILGDAARSIGAWYPPFLAVGSIVGLACMIGLWNMRRWAVFTYTGFFVVNQLVLLAVGIWSIFAFLIPVVVIAIMNSQFEKMR